MKNHYISQLILRRFSKAIHVFDCKKKNVTRYTHHEKIFYKEGIYSDYVEDIMNRQLECPFARLLDNKIMDKEKIEINRQEVLLIKRFLLLDSVKTFSAEEFYSVILRFKENCNRYIKLSEYIDDTIKILYKMPSLEDICDTPFQFQMRAMQLFIECKTPMEMLTHNLCIRELFVWAKIFLDAYLTFWDSNEKHEFILTDNGMTSEYEPSHLLYQGFDLSKESYLQSMLNTTNNDKKKYKYAQLLALNQIMYENFNIFNLSSTRCIVLAHPFFRLYDGKGHIIVGSQESVKFDVPNIWPTFFEDRNIIKTPENRYVIQGEFSENDVFIYEPTILSDYDIIRLNILFLIEAKNLIGFNDYTKVADSLGVMTFYEAVNNEKIYSESCDLGTFVDALLSSPYNYIFKHFKNLAYRGEVSPFEWMEKFALRAMNDTRKNKYVLNKLLEMEHEVRTLHNFDFMGTPDERIALIKSDLENLKK